MPLLLVYSQKLQVLYLLLLVLVLKQVATPHLRLVWLLKRLKRAQLLLVQVQPLLAMPLLRRPLPLMVLNLSLRVALKMVILVLKFLSALKAQSVKLKTLLVVRLAQIARMPSMAVSLTPPINRLPMFLKPSIKALILVLEVRTQTTSSLARPLTSPIKTTT